jgi:hypothetical protein
MASSEATRAGSSAVARWAVAFVLLGVAARTIRWWLDFPFWGDESNLALNFLDRPLLELLGPLDHAQVAPPGFLVAVLLATRGLGVGETALRVVPWLASVGALVTFAWLARIVRGACGSVVTPLAATLAVGIFAVSHYLIRYGSELKPYSCDLLAATLVLAITACWLRDDARRVPGAERWLRILAIVSAPLLLLSYPAILIFGAIGLVVAPGVVRRGTPATWRAASAVSLAVLVGFAVSYGVVGRLQRAAANQGVGYLETFWAEGFPPAGPFAFFGWLIQTHTGLVLAYPNGGRNGGSTATAILVCVGAWVLARRREVPAIERQACLAMLALLLMPFAVGIAAATLRLYPYGGHLRLTLYLAPSVCLLAGLGLERALRALPRESWRAIAPSIALGALLVAGIGDVIADVARPYRDRRHADMRRTMEDAAALAGPNGTIVSLASLEEVRNTNGLGSNYEWYLRTRAPGRIGWSGALGDDALGGGARIVLVAPSPGDGRDDPPALVQWRARHPALEALERRTHCLGKGCSESLVLTVLAARGRP